MKLEVGMTLLHKHFGYVYHLIAKDNHEYFTDQWLVFTDAFGAGHMSIYVQGDYYDIIDNN